jgi:hypothetical protein
MSRCDKLVFSVFSDITVQSVHSPINNTSDNARQYVCEGPVIIIAQFSVCHISIQVTVFCSRRT